MMKDYVPEIGQACFGQPAQRGELSDAVAAALSSIADAWQAVRGDDSPFSNTGARYDGKAFVAHAYSWDDSEDQPFNFAWRDVRISWYKHARRGASINRDMGRAEIAAMISECVGEIAGSAGEA